MSKNNKVENALAQVGAIPLEMTAKEAQFNEALVDFMVSSFEDKNFVSINALKNPVDQIKETIPGILICNGQDCPFARQCTVLMAIKRANPEPKDFVAAVNEIVGEQCRVELTKAVSEFVGLVNHLKIEPTNVIDLTNAADIIKNTMMLDRISKYLANEGLQQDDPAMIHQSTGHVTFRKVSHNLLAHKKQFQDAKYKAISALNASRRDQKEMGDSSNKAAKEWMALIGATVIEQKLKERDKSVIEVSQENYIDIDVTENNV